MRSVSTRFTGLLLVALGVWGGLVPFVGHYFHFVLGPDKAWDWTTGRLYLDVLPGAAVVLGGLNLMSAGPRRSARLGAMLALAGGVWFTIGPEISQLWQAGGAQGAGHGSAHRQMLEMLTYHTGLGVVVAALAAYALPRFTAVTEAVGPGYGRTAAAGAAGAGAGAAASRGEHWYDEPGALDAPVSQRERSDRDRAAQAGDGEYAGEPGTHEHHHVGEAAAAGAGAAGAAAVAHHHHERTEEREAVREGEPVAGERGRERVGAGEPGYDEPIVAGAAARDRGEAEPVPGDHAQAEPVADRGDPEAETVARDRSDPEAETVARDRGDAAIPARDATQETQVRDGAGAPVGDTAATTRSDAYTDHPVGRPRRRGGLLGSLLRR